MKLIVLAFVAVALSSCSTRNESVKLGAGIGLVAGAASTYSAFDSIGEQPSSENMMTGSGQGRAR